MQKKRQYHAAFYLLLSCETPPQRLQDVYNNLSNKTINEKEHTQKSKKTRSLWLQLKQQNSPFHCCGKTFKILLFFPHFILHVKLQVQSMEIS